MNLPNKLTVLRILLVPVMVVVSYLAIPGEIIGISIKNLIITAIFLIGAITDKLDGNIARKRNLVTNFGKFLDPIADKILVISALIILTESGKLPAFVPIIVCFREFLVSGFRLISAKEGTVIAANNWGKAKTATQMVAIIMMMLDNYNFFDFARGQAGDNIFFIIFNALTSIVMAASVVLTIISGWTYLKSGKDLLKDR